jgi:hypothetical protein
MEPGCGEAYWSLADLKTYVFPDDEIASMQALVARSFTDESNQAQLHFALGRALEQRQQYESAFAHYAVGNALRRGASPFDIAKFEAKSQRVAACSRTVVYPPKTRA